MFNNFFNNASYTALMACIGLLSFIVGVNGDITISTLLGGIGFCGFTFYTVKNLQRK